MDYVTLLLIVGVVILTNLGTQYGWPKLLVLFKTDQAKVEAKLTAQVATAQAAVVSAQLALKAHREKYGTRLKATVVSPVSISVPATVVAPVATPVETSVATPIVQVTP